MKKILLFSLTLALLLGLSACEKKGSTDLETDYAHYDAKFEHNGLNYWVINHNSVALHENRSAQGDVVIPSKVKYEGTTYYVVAMIAQAFYDCPYLTSVKIPSTVRIIGDMAFAGCYRLTSVNIPDNVEYIGEAAFSTCEELTSITIPKSVQKIGSCFRIARD